MWPDVAPPRIPRSSDLLWTDRAGTSAGAIVGVEVDPAALIRRQGAGLSDACLVRCGAGSDSTDQGPRTAATVDRAATLLTQPRPRYPEQLRGAGVSGRVIAQFVVDTLGKAEMNTFKVLKASNDLFVGSVKSVLPQMKFYPAEAGGRKVKQLVQMPFKFTAPK